ncbi:MAG: hypothetical protein AABX90_03180, partial [Nanoarchaeota archaeon]
MPRCFEDLDCDDENHLTLDKCVNPGEASAFCTNTEINCASDLDCGVDGFFGEQFCMNEDVFKKFANYTCLNPGTTDSFCDLDIDDNLIIDCNFGCFGGQCLQGVHDVALDRNLTNSVDGIRLEFENGTDIVEDPARLESGLKYKVVVKVINEGNFNESVEFIGEIRNEFDELVLEFEHNPIDNLPPGGDSLKTKTINITLDPGPYKLSVEAVLVGENDDDPDDNKGERLIEMFVISHECSDGIDNDNDGAIDFPADFGCESPEDDSEINDGDTQCSDGIDNDNDGLIDQDDPMC